MMICETSEKGPEKVCLQIRDDPLAQNARLSAEAKKPP